MFECLFCVGLGWVLGRTCQDTLIKTVVQPAVKAIKQICKNVGES